MASIDPYATLGVSKTATADEIKSAYRKLARQYHPDVNPDNPNAEEKFKEVSEAYAILSDPDKRARFDQFGTADEQFGSGGPGPDFFRDGGFGDLFEAFFGGAQQGRRPSPTMEGDDVQASVVVELIDVLHGAEKDVKYRRSAKCDSCQGKGTADGSAPKRCDTCDGTGGVTQVRQTFIGAVRTTTTCPKCRGEAYLVENPCATCGGDGLVTKSEELTVKVPAGVETGQSLRVGGRGSDGVRGGRPGDLYVVMHVAEDKRFERRGPDLAMKYDMTFAQAALGDHVVTDGLDEKIEIEIKAGTQPGELIKIKGCGLPTLRNAQRGDLFVQLNLAVPKKTGEAEAALLREYAEVRGERIPEPKEGFLGGLFKGKKKK